VRPKVNIIGPSYGVFNMPSDLAEIRRLIEGVGAQVNMVFPLGSHVADVARLADAEVNVCMYREFGRQLCEALDRPYLQAPIGLHSTTKFLRKLGELLNIDPNPLSRARNTRRSSQSGTCGVLSRRFLRHGVIRHRRQRNLCARSAQFSRRGNGLPCTFAIARRPGEKTDNAAVRQAVKEKPPLVLFGSYNERMYAAEIGARAVYIPASFPGAIIRRHTGTPFMVMRARPSSFRKYATLSSTHCFMFCRLERSSTRSRRRQRACIASSPGTKARNQGSMNSSMPLRSLFASPPRNVCATPLNARPVSREKSA